MGKSFGIVASCLVALAVVVTPAISDTESSSPEKKTALGVIRLITMAESDYFRANGRYAVFPELVKSGQFGRTATDAPDNLRAFFALDFKSESDPFPGFVLKLEVPSEGNAYQLSLEQKTETCGFRLLANEKGVVTEESGEHCGTGEAASLVPLNWAPPDIDQVVPALHGDGPCPLATIMDQTSHRALELSENLQKFSARERIEHREVGKNGKAHSPTSADFDYVAEVHQPDAGNTYIEEYRTPLHGMQESLAPVVDTGTAAFALVFDPRHINKFSIICEGMSDAGGRPAWLVRFAQRPDRENNFHAYRVNGETYRANLKGFAWIDPDSYEVVRLETDLMEPIPAIALEKEHLVIEYAPVEFRQRDLRLWLPESATLYIALHGRRYQRRHDFSAFQLFSVDTLEKIKEPAALKESAGQETPAQGDTAMGLVPSKSGPHAPPPSTELPLTPK